MSAQRILVVAAALLLAVAAPASAKMVCTRIPMGESCVDKEGLHADHVRLYCLFHAGDPECKALGYRFRSDDLVEQKVDQRLIDIACAANPTLMRCVSPFAVARYRARTGQQ